MCNCLRLPDRFDPWFRPDELYYCMLLVLIIYVVNGICVTLRACPSWFHPRDSAR